MKSGLKGQWFEKVSTEVTTCCSRSIKSVPTMPTGVSAGSSVNTPSRARYQSPYFSLLEPNMGHVGAFVLANGDTALHAVFETPTPILFRYSCSSRAACSRTSRCLADRDAPSANPLKIGALACPTSPSCSIALRSGFAAFVEYKTDTENRLC